MSELLTIAKALEVVVAELERRGLPTKYITIGAEVTRSHYFELNHNANIGAIVTIYDGIVHHEAPTLQMALERFLIHYAADDVKAIAPAEAEQLLIEAEQLNSTDAD